MICSHQDEKRPPDQADFQTVFLGELFIVRVSIEFCTLFVTNFLVFVPKYFVRGGNVKDSYRSLGTFIISAFSFLWSVYGSLESL